MSTPVNRIELAKRFLQEQQNLRDDIVGAWIGGSAAVGEDTESSDLDLIVIVTGDQKANQDGAIDKWVDGVYIDALIVPMTALGSLEEMLQNAFSATHMNHARILYDATGTLTLRQEAVRAVYMEPHWLGERLQFWLRRAHQQVEALQSALSQNDPLFICYHAGHVMLSFISVPLLRAGLAPSSSRGLVRLSPVNRQLHDRIADFEGSCEMIPEDILDLQARFLQWSSIAGLERYKNAPEYVTKKAIWLAQQGFPQAALHAMWVYVYLIVEECIGNEEQKAPATMLAQQWLQAVKWDNEATLQQKGLMAQSLLEELGVLAADLPPG
jgi:hypothetical protein